jgi:hypothetical protein
MLRVLHLNGSKAVEEFNRRFIQLALYSITESFSILTDFDVYQHLVRPFDYSPTTLQAWVGLQHVTLRTFFRCVAYFYYRYFILQSGLLVLLTGF